MNSSMLRLNQFNFNFTSGEKLMMTTF